MLLCESLERRDAPSSVGPDVAAFPVHQGPLISGVLQVQPFAGGSPVQFHDATGLIDSHTVVLGSVNLDLVRSLPQGPTPTVTENVPQAVSATVSGVGPSTLSPVAVDAVATLDWIADNAGLIVSSLSHLAE